MTSPIRRVTLSMYGPLFAVYWPDHPGFPLYLAQHPGWEVVG